MKDNNYFPSTVLIAGGTQGVGKGIALYLAKQGVATLIVCGRNIEDGNETVRLIKKIGVDAYYVQADLSIISGCRIVYEFCANHFHSLNGLVYAAGIMDRGSIETTTEEGWDKIFNTNARGAFFLIQMLLPLLRKTDFSSIVTICSFSSFCGRPNLIAYNASKAALVTLTRSLANALKKEKIRVNGINLGWTDTPNERKIQKSLGNTDNWLEEMGKSQPFGRLIQPQDVAYLVEFLLSQRSMMMTGSIVDFHQNVRV